MTERPILFSDAMVRAILDGRKTQTRRVIKHSHVYRAYHEKCTSEEIRAHNRAMQRPLDIRAEQRGDLIPLLIKHCPYGVPGDRLWVREKWRPAFDHDLWDCIEYRADAKRIKPEGLSESEGHLFHDICPGDEHEPPGKWRPSIHMPRWASRILLEITDVRVQRVQEISEEDALAEGMPAEYAPLSTVKESLTVHRGMHGYTASGQFSALWDRLNAKRGHGWDANPIVWALTFKRIDNDNEN